MTHAQTMKYFREWGLVRAHFIAKGIDPKQAENKRHQLHKQALGMDKSSKDFTNADLDLLNGRVADVEGLVKKVIKGGERWDQPDDKQANIVLGIMQRRIKSQRAAAARHAPPVPGKNPF